MKAVASLQDPAQSQFSDSNYEDREHFESEADLVRYSTGMWMWMLDVAETSAAGSGSRECQTTDH